MLKNNDQRYTAGIQLIYVSAQSNIQPEDFKFIILSIINVKSYCRSDIKKTKHLPDAMAVEVEL
jgi:hypothetical protein